MRYYMLGPATFAAVPYPLPQSYVFNFGRERPAPVTKHTQPTAPTTKLPLHRTSRQHTPIQTNTHNSVISWGRCLSPRFHIEDSKAEPGPGTPPNHFQNHISHRSPPRGGRAEGPPGHQPTHPILLSTNLYYNTTKDIPNTLYLCS